MLTNEKLTNQDENQKMKAGSGAAGCVECAPVLKGDVKYVFVDVEVGVRDHKIHDIGAVRFDRATYHGTSKADFLKFIEGADYLCGHNIVHHDAVYLFGESADRWQFVDTLYMSPLLFPERPYHRLVKDDKLVSDQANNPVNDCLKARDLLFDEIDRWNSLSLSMRMVYSMLLRGKKEFTGFLNMAGTPAVDGFCLHQLVRVVFENSICANADLETLVSQYPCELAYALALVSTTDIRSSTPGWVLRNYPDVEFVLRRLRHTRCETGCPYCNRFLDVFHGLKSFFGYNQFRTFEGEPLQENAAKAAVDGKSLLAIFPTGGGKSLTFQLPALMEGNSVHGLTVVISPLQSLMKDQVDNLSERGITNAVTINGLLDPISRALAFHRVVNGDASLLYISPEMLRSKSVERILLVRNVVRFVVDEAHCFSSWGQDFRVDYLYIGKFIKGYQEKKRCSHPIPVSCFTATAKQKVIQDICDYFNRMLGLNLELFASASSRTNLRYSVIHADTDEEKYQKLRALVEEFVCPTIVYVSRTRRTRELAARLTRDGLYALPFNGKMEADEKIVNQDAFMSGKVRVIVATSAFGMGVDKSDVGLVVHYDISASLEDYVQEAGRAGRDPHLNAHCYVLYSDSDLDKHFILLNQTKLSVSEIQQVWKAVKDMTRQRPRVCCSALEIARQAGWGDGVYDIEMRVRTALAALEQSGYIVRGNNVPHVYATGITVNNTDEARARITASPLFENMEVEKAVRVIKSLISQKYVARASSDDLEAESRVDYLADMLGLTKREVISIVDRMRQDGMLADSKDLTAHLMDSGGSLRRVQQLLERFAMVERFLLNHIADEAEKVSCKQLNEDAQKTGIAVSREKDIRTLLNFLSVKEYIRSRIDGPNHLIITFLTDKDTVLRRFETRLTICRFIVNWLFGKASSLDASSQGHDAVQFSIVQLLQDLKSGQQSLFGNLENVGLEEVEESLLYLSKIGALKLEGGFLVLYNAMDIRRVKDNKFRYKLEDYRMLDEFYKQKIQQVHIVGEYANLMVRDYDEALRFVQNYFQMDYKKFISMYFKGKRQVEILRNVSPEKYDLLFGQLSQRQMQIISDKESRCIVVAAGPGSGKTRVLVHKLASLLLLEDVKHEQLLMLTFSRAAVTEFKQRLLKIIGNAANFVDIKTFHSYCFDLLGRVGNLEDAGNVVGKAAAMIRAGEVEPNKIGKTVLVIDEAQDMGAEDYELVAALMQRNEDMRVIAVGDDDQNIFEFRGSDSGYMYKLVKEQDANFIEMTENFRSSRHIVNYSNAFVEGIARRLKSSPIRSMSVDDGFVEVTHHSSSVMYASVLQDVVRHKTAGKACVLTQTNEEAVIMVALLRKAGVNCRLIQSLSGFRFFNLAEVRAFIKFVDQRISSPVISQDLWEEAKTKLFLRYEGSSCLSYVRRCLDVFEQLNKIKYYTDFKEFVFESNVEDFVDVSGTDMVVSTIHKAKGKEFDDVYLMVSDTNEKDDALMRRLYVGMTRAKKRLFIHSNMDFFHMSVEDKYKQDKKIYEMPNEIVLQLSHKDVHLGYFEQIKRDVLALKGGDALDFRNQVFYDPSTEKPVARLSKTMQAKLKEWVQKGYSLKGTSVRFIVAWKPKDAAPEKPELAIMLPELVLSKDL